MGLRDMLLTVTDCTEDTVKSGARTIVKAMSGAEQLFGGAEDEIRHYRFQRRVEMKKELEAQGITAESISETNAWFRQIRDDMD